MSKASEQTAITSARRESWRKAQSLRRQKNVASGKVLMRVWVTPLEAMRLRLRLRQIRDSVRPAAN